MIYATYAKFLDLYLDDQNGAEKYMRIASNMNHEYLHDYRKLQHSINYQLKKIIKITFIVFDISVIINEIPEIYNFNHDKLIKLLGGQDRIQKLREHFQTNASIYNVHNIVLLSFEHNQYYHIIYQIFNEIDLLQYTQLCKSKTHYFSNDENNQIFNVIDIKDQFNLKHHDEILFISDSVYRCQILNNECKTYFIDNDRSKPLKGITMTDISCIYQILEGINHIDDGNTDVGMTPLSQLDVDLLQNIIKEAKKKITTHTMINLKRKIYTKINQNPEYMNFIKFHDLFKKALHAVSHKHHWTAVQYFNEALQYDSSQLELHRGIAKSLSCLGHHEAAEIAYNNAFTINPHHYYLNLSWGWHLLSTDQPQQALNQFEHTTKLSRYNKEDKNLLTAKAIACERVGDDEKAEIYYKQATNTNEKIYEHAHYNFGMFLKRMNRYDEAKTQLELCMKISPIKYINKPSFIFTLEKLSYSMDASLYINQYKHYILSKLNINDIEIRMGLSESEFLKRFMFDEFWFDEINKLTPKFNGYYDTFIQVQLNNLEILFNNFTNFQSILRDKIVVHDINDMRLIECSLIKHKQHILSTVNNCNC